MLIRKAISVSLGGLLCLFLSVHALRAQELFANAYGGGGEEYAYAIQQTADGGYAFAGLCSTSGAGGFDYWLVKLDPSGAVSWQKTYGGASADVCNAMQQTADGGYVLAGRAQSFGTGDYDFWLLKLDSSGSSVWQKRYGGTGEDYGYSVRQTSDGGYYVAGGTTSSGAGNFDYWILKLDASGNIVWQKTMGGSSVDMAYSLYPAPDGGVVVAGGSVSAGVGNDVWVVKLDSSGNEVWQKSFGGTADDLAFAVQPTADGGSIVAGFTDSFGTSGSRDFWVLKLDSSGNLQWQKTYGGGSVDWAFAVRQAPDGGYVVAGRTDSFGAGGADAWVLKLDSAGTVTWQRAYGGGLLDYAYSIGPAADGTFVVGGVTDSFGGAGWDAMVLKLEFTCVLGGSCPDFSATSVTPGTPSPTAKDTVRNVVTTSVVPKTTAVAGVDAAASRTVQCSYPVLPDTSAVTLTVSKAGASPVLQWDAPGGACAVTGYGVYRGTLPVSPYSHQSLACEVAGLEYTDSSSGAGQYYLVVPHNAYVEGSYGTSYDGTTPAERPPASPPCRPPCLLACP